MRSGPKRFDTNQIAIRAPFVNVSERPVMMYVMSCASSPAPLKSVSAGANRKNFTPRVRLNRLTAAMIEKGGLSTTTHPGGYAAAS